MNQKCKVWKGLCLVLIGFISLVQRLFLPCRKVFPPSDDGQAALADMRNYGASTCRGRLGVKSDGLCAHYDLNSYGATKVALFVSYFRRGLSNQLALMQT